MRFKFQYKLVDFFISGQRTVRRRAANCGFITSTQPCISIHSDSFHFCINRFFILHFNIHYNLDKQYSPCSVGGDRLKL
jgi:hypothetical protein